MVSRIYETKNRVLERIDSMLREGGVERTDLNELGMLVDMVKDLAGAEESCWEAEYYRNVSQAMEAGSGYTRQPMGYDRSMGRSGWQNQYGSGYQSRQGYGNDMVESVRVAMQGMGKEERERMREQLRMAMEM